MEVSTFLILSSVNLIWKQGVNSLMHVRKYVGQTFITIIAIYKRQTTVARALFSGGFVRVAFHVHSIYSDQHLFAFIQCRYKSSACIIVFSERLYLYTLNFYSLFS